MLLRIKGRDVKAPAAPRLCSRRKPQEATVRKDGKAWQVG